MKISLSISPILYHITTLFACSNIADKDRFELKPSDGNTVEEKVGRKSAYYMSTARHKLAAYTRGNIGMTSVILVLDGAKIGYNYEAQPVDYWAGFYGSDPEGRGRMESEDRIYSDTPFINTASKYILEIHCRLNDKRNQLLKLKRYALRHKIPIYFYEDRKALLLLDTRKAVPFDAKMMEPEQAEPMWKYDYEQRKMNDIAGYLQLYNQSPNTKNEADKNYTDKTKYLTKKGKRAYEELRYIRMGDAQKDLENAMHNQKSVQYGDLRRSREDLDKLVSILRKNRWTVAEFCLHLYGKWYGYDR